MKVSWTDKKGNVLNGVIDLIKPRSRKNINVLDSNGKLKIIPFTNLTIIKESTEPTVEPVEPVESVVEVVPIEPTVEVVPIEPTVEVVPTEPTVEVVPIEPSVEIKDGDEVKWTDKTGKVLEGKIKNKTMKNYIICCKKDNSTWRVPIDWPSLTKK